MLTEYEENYILNNAYIPEHLVGLMTSVSRAEPYLIEDCLCCCRDDWVILVGYPIQNEFRTDVIDSLLDEITTKFQTRRISIVAPSLPGSLHTACGERGSDFYYTLDIPVSDMKPEIKRNIKKAQQNLQVEFSRQMGKAHQDLMEEFIQRINPPARVKNLLFKMPDYLNHVNQSMIINAWDANENLVAFYVIDLTAKDFINYIIGGYSKKYYVRGASDLLLFELVKTSEDLNKRYIHLGLGINEGIRSFKKKWGGHPTRSYEMCELKLSKPSILQTIMAITKSRSL